MSQWLLTGSLGVDEQTALLQLNSSGYSPSGGARKNSVRGKLAGQMKQVHRATLCGSTVGGLLCLASYGEHCKARS